MILPIVAYGHPVLRKRATDITADYPQLEKLIADMWETLYNSNGVGLAAPQIGLAIRLFVIDTEPFSDSKDLTPEEQALLSNFKRTFINAKMIKEEGEEWGFNEGCLSIPDVKTPFF